MSGIGIGASRRGDYPPPVSGALAGALEKPREGAIVAIAQQTRGLIEVAENARRQLRSIECRLVGGIPETPATAPRPSHGDTQLATLNMNVSTLQDVLQDLAQYVERLDDHL